MTVPLSARGHKVKLKNLHDMKSYQRRYSKEDGVNYSFMLSESSFIELRKLRELTGKSMAAIGVELLEPEIKSMLALIYYRRGSSEN